MAAVHKVKNGDQPLIKIPAFGTKKQQGGDDETLITPVSPKTPADEGIDFFQAEAAEGEAPIRVYELRLDPDGGPNKELSVCHLSSTLSSRSYLRLIDGSIFVSRPRIRRTSSVFPYRRVRLLRRMGYSRRISLWMAVYLGGISSRRERGCRYD